MGRLEKQWKKKQTRAGKVGSQNHSLGPATIIPRHWLPPLHQTTPYSPWSWVSWAMAGRPLSARESQVQSSVLFSLLSALNPSVFSPGLMALKIISMMLIPKFISPFHLFFEIQSPIQLSTQHLNCWSVSKGKFTTICPKTELLFFPFYSSLHLSFLILVKGHSILPLSYSSFSHFSSSVY